MHSPAKLDKKRSISIIPALLRKPGTIFWDNPGSIDNVCGHVAKCGNSSVVEHNLAKVGVASSSLVSRSIFKKHLQVPFFAGNWFLLKLYMAGWQSGYAAACKAVYAGSIPTPASREYPFGNFQ